VINSDPQDSHDDAPDGMCQVGPDGTILWANAAQLELLGYTADEYIGKHITTFYDDRTAIDDILTRVRQHETIRSRPARVRHRDGTAHDVLITSSGLWHDGEFVHNHFVMRDVTEQLRLQDDHRRLLRQLTTEHALRGVLASPRTFREVASEVLRTLGESEGWECGILWLPDQSTNTLRFVEGWQAAGACTEFVDDSRLRVFAPGVGLPGRVWTRGEAVWIEDVVHSENFPRASYAEHAGLHAAIAFPIRVHGSVGGVIEFFTAEVRKPDADLVQLLDTAGVQIGLFIERREIDEVRDRLAAIVNSSDDAIVSKTLDGVITSWNRGAEQIFGYTAEEAVGRHITLIVPDDLRAEEAEVLARLRRGEKIDHYQTVRRRKDGRLIDISLTVSPVRNADERIVGASKVARDISPWKRAEERLRESEQQAIAAVQARDDFLSVAAHELRNPLNAVQLQLVGLYRAAQADDALSQEWVVDRLSQATEDVGALVRLVHNLLDVARISAGRIDVEPEDLDFGDVIRAVVRRFGHTLAGRELALEVPAVKGRSDRLRLEQVITNLVSNAIKFGEGKPIEIALRADDERAYFSVTDHGIGIDPERQSELFARFSRAVSRREYGGFGLGLWIARETVLAMGGEIWLTSAPGEGSTFSVSLPRVLAAGAGNYAVN
jgi:two-component system sensor histidine kinase VicK